MNKMDNIENYLQVPLKCHITRDQNDQTKYTIHIEKYGERFNGISINLTEEQTKQIYFWR